MPIRRDLWTLALVGLVLFAAAVVMRSGGGAAVTQKPDGVRETRGDRPVEALPADPRRPSDLPRHRPFEARANPPPSSADAGIAEGIAVRVVDSTDNPRAATTIELRAAAPGGGAGAIIGDPVVTDSRGLASVLIPLPSRKRELVLTTGLLLEEPLAIAVSPSAAQPILLRTPEVGAVEIRLVDENGAVFAANAEAWILLGTNDPPADPVVRQRHRRPFIAGVARFEGVEAGTVVLVEARFDDAALVTIPRLIEGPSAEGATSTVTLAARRRDMAAASGHSVADDGGVSRPGIKRHSAVQGPAAAGGSAPAAASALAVTLKPYEALPHWPLSIQLELTTPTGGAVVDARVDAKGKAALVAPAGRYEIRMRLFRAAPDGWTSVELRGESAAPLRTEIRSGTVASQVIDLDSDAIAAAVARLVTDG